MGGGTHNAAGFVGRRRERRLLDSLLAAHAPERVVYVQGPPGIGKTALLQVWAEEARGRGHRLAWIDAASLPASRRAAWRATADALEVEAESPRQLAGALTPGPRLVLVIDGLEWLGELEGWLRDVLLPALPAESVVLMAGRVPLQSEWMADPGWMHLLRRVRLGPLERSAAKAYLDARGARADSCNHLLDLCAGHPLALVVAADVARRAQELPVGLALDELTSILVDELLWELPSERHRLAIEVLCLLGHTTEELLSCEVGEAQAPDLFRWLEGLGFVERTPHGLAPHDLVREIVGNAVVARDRPRYRAIVATARDFVAERWRSAEESERLRLRSVTDSLVYHAMSVEGLLSDPRPFAPMPPPRAVGASQVDYQTWQRVEEIVTLHEGPEALRWLRAWRDHATLVVTRDPEGDVACFSLAAQLRGSVPQHVSDDPGIGVIGPLLDPILSRGGAASLILFAGARDDYHGPGPYFPAMTHGFRSHFEEQLDAELIAAAAHEPERHRASFEASGLRELAVERFHRGRVELTWSGPELREGATVESWWFEHELRILNVVGPATNPSPRHPGSFRREVMTALRKLSAPRFDPPASLRELRIVARRAERDGITTDDAVRELLLEQCHMFDGAPRDRPLRDVVHRTYLSPPCPQREIARELGMSFGTYRRHLGTGVRRIADALWALEQEMPGELGAGTAGVTTGRDLAHSPIQE